MGLAIEKEHFSDAEFEHFERRLQENIVALEQLMRREGFGEGPMTLGAELEIDIIDPQARPLAVNREVLADHLDPQLQLELNSFNLEYNLLPVSPDGKPFAALGQQLDQALEALRGTVSRHNGRVLAVGILPTFQEQDLQSSALTDLPRYKALSNGLRRVRRAPFRIRIDGEEPIDTTCDDVTVEGANTSFQVHLRTNPERFANLFNAAQLATPLVLAAAGNSPIFLEHRLWQETRIALFKQAVDARSPDVGAWRRAARVPFGHGWVRRGALELFAEAARLFPPLLPICDEEKPVDVVASGAIPRLSELRVQQGTVWQWNRPVYDPADGGHLRIEFRVLPSGPTVIDMMANAAFMTGLTIALSRNLARLLPAFPFKYAEYNFYRAAQAGLGAKLLWPTEQGLSPCESDATKLIEQCLPLAAEGLDMLGVDDAEAGLMLGLVGERLHSGQTGSKWQLSRLAYYENNGAGRSEALALMVNDYEALFCSGQPVHEWPPEA